MKLIAIEITAAPPFSLSLSLSLSSLPPVFFTFFSCYIYRLLFEQHQAQRDTESRRCQATACHYTRKIVPLGTNMSTRADFHVDEVRGDRVSGRIATHRRIGPATNTSARVSLSFAVTRAVMTRSHESTLLRTTARRTTVLI